ncbi:MAG: gliding motility-associatede transport system auxiliary component [Verrucomicrobiota bacterium]|nr:gliding motility-associatede transport system auxiliary component [Verrucomicrobiota bacterium]
MANPPSKPAGIKRLRIGTNVVLQTIIFAMIVLMINYLGFNRYRRWDLSRNNKYALSELTKKFLRSLKKDVKIYVFFAPTSQSAGSELYYDLQNLLKEYEFAGKRRVQVETIDPYRNLTRTRELQVKYNFGADENLVILDYENRKKILRVADMAEYDPPGMFSETPQVRAFRGEQVITSALIELTENKETKIGFITGHGEPSLEDGSPLARFREYVERQSMRLEPLILTNLEKIPTDYAAIILSGPKYDLGERDFSLLRTYWNEQGRILIMLDPKVKTPKLDQFISEFGVWPEPDLIVTQFKTGIEEQSVTLDVYAQFLPETSFLRALSQATGFFPGGTCSLSIDEPKIAQRGLTLTKALTPAAPDYWGDKDEVLDSQKTPTYAQGIDLPPPLYFGIALEKGDIKDARVQLHSSSRMIILGNADFLRNESLNESPPDVDFILMSINWLADREQLMAISPKATRTFTLNLSDAQMSEIVLLTVAGIPMLIALLGLGVWSLRRR